MMNLLCLFSIIYFSNLSTITLPVSTITKVNPIIGEYKVGSSQIQVAFCFDLQADITWIHSKSCAKCSDHTEYSCSGSSTCKALEPYSYSLNGYELKGTKVEDTIDFITFNLQTQILEVTEETFDVPAFDGCIAFGYSSFKSNTHLISKLISMKLIDKPMIGIHLDTEKLSEIKFGGYNTAYVKVKNIVWSNIESDWSYSIADLSLKEYHSGPISLALITNSPNFRAPKDVYDKIFAVIKSKAICIENKCEMLESDYLVLPSIKLRVTQQTKWKFGYAHYTKELKRFKKLESCTSGNCKSNEYVSFEFLMTKGDRWGIGTNGLKHFYVILDYELKRIGLVYQDSVSHKMILAIVLTIILVIAVIVVITLIVELKCKSPKK